MKAAAAIFIIFSLSACYRNTLRLTPAGEAVKVTVNAESVRGCTSLGALTATSEQGGTLTGGPENTNADNKIRNDAGKLGANVLLVADRNSGFRGTTVRGEAYNCTPTP